MMRKPKCSSQDASWPFGNSVLPEKAILGQEPHPEGTAETVTFMLTCDVDLAVQDQVEPVLTRLFGVTVDSVRVSLDLDSPVLIVRDVQTRIHNLSIVECDRSV